jgi:hypothetical protein
MPKVNYLIAAADHRIGRPQSDFRVDGADILKLHLRELRKTDLSKLSQVTILRITQSGEKESCISSYWDVEEQIKDFGCPVVMLDIKHECLSYGAWVRAVQKYQEEFDYYIIIEDDYYPVLHNFVEVLTSLHNRLLPNGGYLNSLTACKWAAISNGIIDSATFLRAIKKVKDPIEFISKEPQVRFSYLFAPLLDDYLDFYRSLFMRYEGTILWEEYRDGSAQNKQDIFNPIEYLVQSKMNFPKNKWDKVVWNDNIMDSIKDVLSEYII